MAEPNIKLPFKSTSIRRYELPAYERKGCVAQEVTGKELILVFFHQTKTEFEYLTGLPVVGLSKKLSSSVPSVDIRDTVTVGFQKKKSAIVLIDILNLGGKSVRGKRWDDRLETLRLLHAKFAAREQALFPLAREWSRGLIRAFDEVVKSGGIGLLLRFPAKPHAMLCMER